ncbi:hypothetical protein H2198_008514 [Neophaeococcomyces mojaviensis]|uniref:Uncharacterized protein n=1 Tax=Neophaeococcomyces mojaviensis TaxID=3383035 RepID=A0ACC2ZXP4_9EURO|nr:hypothetical protein H2198_008514 [Knufia sp. JES_112]
MSYKTSGPKTRPDRVKPVSVPSPSPRSRSSSTSSTATFASAVEAQNGGPKADEEVVRFSQDEEAQMLEASHQLKNAANKQFASKDYSSAISTYDKALAELPIYLDYELAVLQSNIAACHLQLQEWKDAIQSAEKGLEMLEREMPMPKSKEKKGKDQDAKGPGEKQNDDDDSKVVELPDDNDDEANTEMLKKLDISDQRKTDILRIRTKLLLRRARAKVMITEQPVPSPTAPKPASYIDPDDPTTTEDALKPKKPDAFSAGSTWGNLSTALSDYQILAQPEYFHRLPQPDQKTVIEMLRTLPKRVEEAKEREVGEMMGKLKELGNGILKPFGLSTDMFKMVQDPSTGGWSMNFDGKSGK